MNRRLFAKLLALGAGSLPFLSLRGADSPKEGSPPPVAPPPSDGVGPEPVNVEDVIPLAQAKLPKGVFDYITSGSEGEITLRENLAAFQRMQIAPPILRGVADPDPSTTVLGQRISLPVMLAPASLLALFHPEGALASSRAAAAAGTIFVASTNTGHSVEEIGAAAKGPTWFQLYVPRDRKITRRLVERAERAGFGAIVVTVDLGERKDQDRRNRFTVPKELFLRILRNVGHEQLSEAMTHAELTAFNQRAWDLSFSWDFFRWLRSVTKLPLIVKGVLTKADALKAVELGLDGIVVSNHGGRRLDTSPASIDVLEEIATAVNGRLEILLDSGVRRGTDVMKAVALGAKAVLVGRPYVWGLAANGEEGVTMALGFLREEFLNAMFACGCAHVGEIRRELVL